MKKHESQYSAKRYLYDSTSDADHYYEVKVTLKYGIPEAVKLETNKLFALHMIPVMTAPTK